MPKRIGKYTLEMENDVRILNNAAIVGHKEAEGPLAKYFDKTYSDDKFGESSWEKAESFLQKSAVELALKKAEIDASSINYIFAGDLLNQCISSTFGLRALGIPFLGQYGACSTMAQTISMASVFTDSFAADRCVAVTSSHFCSAERQFRFPLEYGGQRTPTAQWTVTGSGAAIIQRGGNGIKIKRITIGRITDMGIKDANNMGAAMAPAAAQTILDYFSDTKEKPQNFDLILTGDLGMIGKTLLLELLEKEGLKISRQHNDCGLMIFDIKTQDVHAGGSGCGCSGSVFCSYVLQKMKTNELKRVLFVATGALMSPTSAQQGESIPGVAHLIELESE
ncbi:MAG: stage V sporulation protein AD [Candidatus Pseudoruminococcus sp.]|nr:stage V sporulation protein AD [Ruminococcus sp.]MDY2783153.1 stage V sporulation protein AD [Candidatus Pseudoruminococcus sp.]